MDIRVKITRDKSNVVKTMDIEEYLRGVVPSEMSSTWPMEALKAQAVAARTYAVGHLNPARAYDVDDTVTYQAFHLGRTRKRSDEAIKATKGEVLVYQKNLAQAVYSASNGGKTVSAKQRWKNDIPYLIAQNDPYDKASGEKKNGHGVGMSQHGARQAALQGKNYKDILAFYYPGCHLSIREESDKIKTIPKIVNTDVSPLYIRSGPGREHSVLAKIDRGEVVLGREQSGNWTHIGAFVNDKLVEGWSASEFLEDYTNGG